MSTDERIAGIEALAESHCKYQPEDCAWLVSELKRAREALRDILEIAEYYELSGPEINMREISRAALADEAKGKL